jgi:hypothetical protein
MKVSEWFQSQGVPLPLLVLGLIIITLLPSLIAILKRHADLRTIIILNLLFFWTWAVWIGLLVWSASGVQSKLIKDRVSSYRKN